VFRAAGDVSNGQPRLHRRGCFFILLAYVGYFITTLIQSGGRIAFTPRRWESTPFNALLLALLTIGLPALAFALKR
jgi:hypothetical protein